jgi:membrane protein YdbS with pleckstrin-like domain
MKSVKVIVDILFVALFLLITFFGIGPVLFADGSDRERMNAFLVVLLIYAIWFILLTLWRRKSRKMFSK